MARSRPGRGDERGDPVHHRRLAQCVEQQAPEPRAWWASATMKATSAGPAGRSRTNRASPATGVPGRRGRGPAIRRGPGGRRRPGRGPARRSAGSRRTGTGSTGSRPSTGRTRRGWRDRRPAGRTQQDAVPSSSAATAGRPSARASWVHAGSVGVGADRFVVAILSHGQPVGRARGLRGRHRDVGCRPGAGRGPLGRAGGVRLVLGLADLRRRPDRRPGRHRGRRARPGRTRDVGRTPRRAPPPGPGRPGPDRPGRPGGPVHPRGRTVPRPGRRGSTANPTTDRSPAPPVRPHSPRCCGASRRRARRGAEPTAG